MGQPVYVLASVLETSRVVELVPAAGEEMKFSSLITDEEGQALVARLLRELDDDQAKTYVVDKRFMAIAKLVDDLVEPYVEATGFDLYAEDSHIGMTSILWVVLAGFAGEDRLNETVERFVVMMRTRSEESFDSFFHYLESLREIGGKVNDQVEFLLIVLDFVRKEIIDSPPGYYEIDPAIPTLQALSSAWSDQLEEPHLFVHDNSHAVERWRPDFLAFNNPAVSRTSSKFGSRTVTVPGLTFDLQFADSKTEPLIQVADVVAGATRYWFQGIRGYRDKNKFWRTLDRCDVSRFVEDFIGFVPPDS